MWTRCGGEEADMGESGFLGMADAVWVVVAVVWAWRRGVGAAY